jgi:hypothetical protein
VLDAVWNALCGAEKSYAEKSQERVPDGPTVAQNE